MVRSKAITDVGDTAGSELGTFSSFESGCTTGKDSASDNATAAATGILPAAIGTAWGISYAG